MSTRGAIVIVAIAGLIAAIVILREYRDLTFFYDEWDVVQGRRDWDADTFLRAHNEHLAVVTVAVFKLLFVTAGLTSYWPYAVVLVLSHLLCAGVFFVLARSWSSNETAVFGTVVLLFLGTAWEVLLWPFELGVSLSLAAGMGAIIALGRGTRRGDAAACGLLALSLASASVGVPFAAAVLVLLGAGPGWTRRAYVVAVPVLLYGAWFLAYGNSSARAENIPQVPVFVADSGAAALAGVFGMSPEIGRSIFIVVAVITVAALLGRRAEGDRIAAVVTVAGVMWILLCLARFGIAEPNTPRYVYPGAALMLMLLVILVGGRVVSAPRARVIGLVLLAASLTTNIGLLRDGGERWRGYSAQVRAEIGAMTEIRDHVPADFQPSSQYGPQIRAGTFFAAVDDLGSPAWGPDRIRTAGTIPRLAADEVLRRAGAVTIDPAGEPTAGARPPMGAVVLVGSLTAGPSAGCVTATPLPGGTMRAQIPVPAAGLQVRGAAVAGGAPIGVRLTRFADISGDPMVTLPPDGSARRISTRWVATSSWRLEATSATPVILCSVR